ncbi:protein TRIGALACTOSYLDIACYLGLYCEROL 4, chloroplastic [Neltuma alba]|uniref:protein TRIGALACTOSYLDIACYLGLYCEROL 4, chloroplastic n=1 Tax=Neltuma alba TaxID=207710 RepID=UPI0010A5074E|nr:protein TRIGALACTOSYLDIACYLGLYCEROL 4, chloroplastic [Prosopis alba]
MANLRTAMDSAFWDLNVSSPRTIDGCAKAVPGDPFPMDATVSSKALRIQQFSCFRNGFPLGIVPCLSPTSQKSLGSLSLQSLALKVSNHPWWLGLIGQFRPRKLFADIKNEISNAEEFELSTVKDVAKHFIDKSLFSFGLFSQYSVSDSTSILLSMEGHGEKKRGRNKMMIYHQLPDHDITLEAAWPQLFIDHKGNYWDVPESISLDLSSLKSDSGLRYRFGIHKNGGYPEAVNAIDGIPPLSLLPGLCAKAAFSYEKIKYLWKDNEVAESLKQTIDKPATSYPYDVRLMEPQSAISGIIGGACTAWIWDERSYSSVDSREDLEMSRPSMRSPLSGDLFGSVCYTFQHGKFTNDYGDLTRLDARLDICSASGFAKKVLNGIRSYADVNELPSASPRLNLTFQQQVAGPIIFRTDSRISLESFSKMFQMEDYVCSLSYSFRMLQSGKVVAWYSPKRKEGMVELRLFEF